MGSGQILSNNMKGSSLLVNKGTTQAHSFMIIDIGCGTSFPKMP